MASDGLRLLQVRASTQRCSANPVLIPELGTPRSRVCIVRFFSLSPLVKKLVVACGTLQHVLSLNPFPSREIEAG